MGIGRPPCLPTAPAYAAPALPPPTLQRHDLFCRYRCTLRLYHAWHGDIYRAPTCMPFLLTTHTYCCGPFTTSEHTASAAWCLLSTSRNAYRLSTRLSPTPPAAALTYQWVDMFLLKIWNGLGLTACRYGIFTAHIWRRRQTRYALRGARVPVGWYSIHRLGAFRRYQGRYGGAKIFTTVDGRPSS